MKAGKIRALLEEKGMDMSAVIEISAGEIEVFVDSGTGRADEKRVAKAVARAERILGWRGGYRTGCGGFVLQETPVSRGDYNHPSSQWHR
jgi:hypothetical protein